MSKNRKRYREKRKQKKLEERLERINGYGFTDVTPYEAVLSIIEKEKRENRKRDERRVKIEK